MQKITLISGSFFLNSGHGVDCRIIRSLEFRCLKCVKWTEGSSGLTSISGSRHALILHQSPGLRFTKILLFHIQVFGGLTKYAWWPFFGPRLFILRHTLIAAIGALQDGNLRRVSFRAPAVADCSIIVNFKRAVKRFL